MKVYEFTAPNTETLYGYGSEDDAIFYLLWLNKNRQINLYEFEESIISKDSPNIWPISFEDNIVL